MTWLKAQSDGCNEYVGYWVLVLLCAWVLTYTQHQTVVDSAITWIHDSNNVTIFSNTVYRTLLAMLMWPT